MRRLLIIAGLLGFAISAYAQGDAPGGRLGTRDAQEAIRRASAEPTPRLPDGTPNLGRVGTEKGIQEEGSGSETHRDHLRRRRTHLARDLYGRPPASSGGQAQRLIVAGPLRGTLGR